MSAVQIPDWYFDDGLIEEGGPIPFASTPWLRSRTKRADL